MVFEWSLESEAMVERCNESVGSLIGRSDPLLFDFLLAFLNGFRVVENLDVALEPEPRFDSVLSLSSGVMNDLESVSLNRPLDFAFLVDRSAVEALVDEDVHIQPVEARTNREEMIQKILGVFRRVVEKISRAATVLDVHRADDVEFLQIHKRSEPVGDPIRPVQFVTCQVDDEVLDVGKGLNVGVVVDMLHGGTSELKLLI